METCFLFTDLVARLNICYRSRHLVWLVSLQDFGYVQVTSTENLKAYVCNQPEVVTTTEEPLWQCTGRIVVHAHTV